MSSGKRKRESLPEEIEVDVNAAEPPSKRALRRAKKGKSTNPAPQSNDDDDLTQSTKEITSKADIDAIKQQAPGIWIGNLPWTVTKADLLKFLTEQKGKSTLVPTDITRVRMPGPAASSAQASKHKKLANRGFAYVDFKTTEARDCAIALSESLLAGRAVLIKDSKSFEGRPDQATKNAVAEGKPPSCRIFVGNLGFDATEEDLRVHFARCGQVKSVFVATFPDSGQCKGFAWVTFDELVSAEKAMRGWVELDPEEIPEEDESTEGGEEARSAKAQAGEEEHDAKAIRKARKKAKPRKWFVNRLKGRDLRMEYAEDATTRYQKRYGKGKLDRVPGAANQIVPPEEETTEPVPDKYKHRVGERPQTLRRKRSTEGVREDRKPREGRTTKSKDVAYRTGGIMEGKGKKVTFD